MCRITPTLTGKESPGVRLFSDDGFKRNIDGTEMAGWDLKILLESFVVLSFAILFYPHSLVPHACAVTTRPNSLVSLSLGLIISFSAVLVYAFFGSKHAARVTIGAAHLKGTYLWPVPVMSSYYG